MTNPWTGLDADSVNKKLYLDPTVIADVNRVYEPYEDCLEKLIGDTLDETTGYFGTPENPLATEVQKLFDSRGKELTDYLNAQAEQAHAFVKTARQAADAMRASQND
ncbi:hypothetical protein BVU76_24140 [Mycolicibacterium porcinum]|nr:hypothetical protein BVU76_24140 [Mycolicibacterium porcinum]